MFKNDEGGFGFHWTNGSFFIVSTPFRVPKKLVFVFVVSVC